MAWRMDIDNCKPMSGEAERQMWSQERFHQVAKAFDVNGGRLQRGVHCSYKRSRDHWEGRHPWPLQLALYVSSAEKTLPPTTQMLGMSRTSAQWKLPILIVMTPHEIHALKSGRKESHGKPGWGAVVVVGVDKHSCHLGWGAVVVGGVDRHSCHPGQISCALFTVGKGHQPGSLPRPS